MALRTAAVGAVVLLTSCAAGPAVTSISVKYTGSNGFTPVSAATVEVKKERETRPYEQIAVLSVPTDDGSSFETLVQRLRERAASIGADAIVEVDAIYESSGGPPAATSSNTNLPDDAGREAAATGLTLLIHRPKWVSVRGIAIRLKERHLGERSFLVHDPSDNRPSPVQDAQRVGVPKPTPAGPSEQPPVDQPHE